MLLETAPPEVGRENQNSLADFFNGFRNLVERRRERLNVLAFERSDERFAELFG